MKTSKKLLTLFLALCLIICFGSAAFAAAFEQEIEFDDASLVVTGEVDANGAVTIEKVMSGEEDLTAEYADNADLAAALSPLVYDAEAARAEAFGIGGAGDAAPAGESEGGESPEGESPEGESAEGESPEGESGGSGSSAEPVVYDNYVDESAVHETFTFDGSTYGANEGSYLTVVIDGVEVDPAALNGEYENVEFIVTPQIPAFVDGYESAYRTGLYYADGLQEEYSVTEAVAGEYDDNGGKDIVIKSENANFEGIIAASGEYTFDNVSIRAEGNGANDFAGVGAGIAAGGTSKVTKTIMISWLTASSATACSSAEMIWRTRPYLLSTAA